jgi:hypothetical protein
VERGFEPPPAAVLPCAASHRASCPSAATEHFGNEYRVIVQAAVCCIPIPHSRLVQPPYVLVLRGLIFRVMIPPLVFCSWSRLVPRLSKSRSNRSRGTIDQSPCIRCTYASCGWDPSSCVLCCAACRRSPVSLVGLRRSLFQATNQTSINSHPTLLGFRLQAHQNCSLSST